MKYILFIALFLSIGLEAQSLPEIVNQKETLLVDVRTPEEFTQGSVKNAVNIPLKDLESHIQQFRGKKNIVVFCRRGNRSAEAKKILQKFDIKNVFDGGAWQNVQNLVKTSILENVSFANKPSFYKVKENITLKNIKQEEEEDFSFLNKIAQDEGVKLKISSGILILFDLNSNIEIHK